MVYFRCNDILADWHLQRSNLKRIDHFSPFNRYFKWLMLLLLTKLAFWFSGMSFIINDIAFFCQLKIMPIALRSSNRSFFFIKQRLRIYYNINWMDFYRKNVVQAHFPIRAPRTVGDTTPSARSPIRRNWPSSSD